MFIGILTKWLSFFLFASCKRLRFCQHPNKNLAIALLSLSYFVGALTLKYGFCKKLLTSVQISLWPVEHFFPHFLTGLLCDQSKGEEKVFNWSELHLYRSNFLQNPYLS